MAALEIFLTWIHILCAVIFLGTMFVGTFVLLPVLKTYLDYGPRQQFIENFIPKVRGIMTAIISLLLLSGVGQLIRIYLTRAEPAESARLGVFVLHVLFAAVPFAIFALAPRILGAKSLKGLCCDPDAEEQPVWMGVTTSTSKLLHFTAIGSGSLAVLCAIILTRMH